MTKISVATIFVLWLFFNQHYQFFSVTSGSMEPSINIGDMLIVEKQTNYHKNDVVTFTNSSQRIVTHRITDLISEAKNSLFATAGDANRNNDYDKINQDQIFGKVISVIPLLGKLSLFSNQLYFLITLIIVPALLLIIYPKKYIVFFIPIIIGLITFKTTLSSADLNDEVSIKQNKMKATTLELSSLNSADGTKKNYLFNIANFKKDGLDAATLRVKNTGQENTSFYISTKLDRSSETCNQKNIKVINVDKFVFSGQIKDFFWHSEQISSNQFIDLIFILNNTDNQNTEQQCNYQFTISTNPASDQPPKGLSDTKSIFNTITLNP